MIKILAVLLAALTCWLGVHLMFEIGVAATLLALVAVISKASETGWHWAPRVRVT